MALRRPPTRLELKADDIDEYTKVSAESICLQNYSSTIRSGEQLSFWKAWRSVYYYSCSATWHLWVRAMIELRHDPLAAAHSLTNNRLTFERVHSLKIMREKEMSMEDNVTIQHGGNGSSSGADDGRAKRSNMAPGAKKASVAQRIGIGRPRWPLYDQTQINWKKKNCTFVPLDRWRHDAESCHNWINANFEYRYDLILSKSKLCEKL